MHFEMDVEDAAEEATAPKDSGKARQVAKSKQSIRPTHFAAGEFKMAQCEAFSKANEILTISTTSTPLVTAASLDQAFARHCEAAFYRHFTASYPARAISPRIEQAGSHSICFIGFVVGA
jgi:hypothetical protein